MVFAAVEIPGALPGPVDVILLLRALPKGFEEQFLVLLGHAAGIFSVGVGEPVVEAAKGRRHVETPGVVGAALQQLLPQHPVGPLQVLVQHHEVEGSGQSDCAVLLFRCGPQSGFDTLRSVRFGFGHALGEGLVGHADQLVPVFKTDPVEADDRLFIELRIKFKQHHVAPIKARVRLQLIQRQGQLTPFACDAGQFANGLLSVCIQQPDGPCSGSAEVFRPDPQAQAMVRREGPSFTPQAGYKTEARRHAGRGRGVDDAQIAFNMVGMIEGDPLRIIAAFGALPQRGVDVLSLGGDAENPDLFVPEIKGFSISYAEGGCGEGEPAE